MPRPRRCRRIWFEPNIRFFKPAGVRITDLDESTLTFDEAEAIRLKDLKGMEQGECAKKMNISQPTFHRLILAARKKIADAIVNGKAIRIEGGVYKMAGRRARMRWGGPPASCVCPSCGFQTQKQRGMPCSSMKCPKCGKLMARGD